MAVVAGACLSIGRACVLYFGGGVGARGGSPAIDRSNRSFPTTPTSTCKQDAAPSQRRAFRGLVRSGRLELVAGGWVMHDEAIAGYESQVHQMRTVRRWGGRWCGF